MNLIANSNPIGASLLSGLTPPERLEVGTMLDGMLREPRRERRPVAAQSLAHRHGQARIRIMSRAATKGRDVVSPTLTR